MREARVRPLGGEDPLEKEMATHSSTLAWKIQWTEEPGGLQSMRSQRVGHDWVTSLHSSLQFKHPELGIHGLTFSSVHFSRSVVSDSLQSHESQHTRPPYPSPIPGVYSNSCPSIGDAIQPSHPMLSPSTPAPNSSQHQSLFPMSQLFTWGGESIGVFSFSVSPSNEHPGLISFRMDWLDLLAVQGTLKSFLQHHSSKASIFQHSAFFTVQLLHPYMTTSLDQADLCWQSNVSAF